MAHDIVKPSFDFDYKESTFDNNVPGVCERARLSRALSAVHRQAHVHVFTWTNNSTTAHRLQSSKIKFDDNITIEEIAIVVNVQNLPSKNGIQCDWLLLLLCVAVFVVDVEANDH